MILWFVIFMFLGLLSGVMTLRHAFTTEIRNFTLGDWFIFVTSNLCGVALCTLCFWIALHLL